MTVSGVFGPASHHVLKRPAGRARAGSTTGSRRGSTVGRAFGSSADAKVLLGSDPHHAAAFKANAAVAPAVTAEVAAKANAQLTGGAGGAGGTGGAGGAGGRGGGAAAVGAGATATLSSATVTGAGRPGGADAAAGRGLSSAAGPGGAAAAGGAPGGGGAAGGKLTIPGVVVGGPGVTPGVGGALPTQYVKSAKDLRSGYSQIVNSPEGVDVAPLTVPKCVECAHCGWPVFVRDSKVATKKTYARAGIIRGPKKKEGEDGTKAPGEEGAGEEEESDADSRDTVEQLTDQVEELEDKVNDLEESNELLEEQKQELQTELDETKEALRVAEERIEFLEESEQRWRDKNSVLRLENQRLLLYIDRMAMRREDLETDLKNYIAECNRLRQLIARRRRRRNLMLDSLEQELMSRDEVDVLGLSLRMWRRQAVEDKLLRKLTELETRRLREVNVLTTNVFSLLQRKVTLEHWCDYYQRRLKNAAHKYLQKCMSTKAWPWAAAHAMSAWAGVTPYVFVENRLEETTKVLADTKDSLAVERKLHKGTKGELEVMDEDRLRLIEVEKTLIDRCGFYEKELGEAALNAAEAKRQAEREKEEAMRKAMAAVEAKWKARQEEWEEAREAFEQEIRTLESRLAAAEAMVGTGDGAAVKDETWRVVPKGQGVLCVGCLRQLVHRSVKPLPPIEAMKIAKAGGVSEKLDKAKKQFFETELGGVANADDALHSMAYKIQRDPYGLAKLNIWPENVKAPPSPKPGETLAELELASPMTTANKTKGRWPRISSPKLTKDRGKGLGRAVSTPTVRMRETFSKDFRPSFR